MKRWRRLITARLAGLPRPSAAKLKGTALAAVLLLAGWWGGIWLFFPATALENRLEREAAIHLREQGSPDLEGIAPAFPLGLSARRATLRLNQLPELPIAASALRLRPLWLSLPTGNAGLAFEGGLFDGRIEGSVRQDGQTALQLEGLRLHLPLRPGSPLALSGTVEAGELATRWPPRENSASRLELRIAELRLVGLDAVGAASGELLLGTLLLQGSGTGTSFKLDRLEGQDGQLTISGSGTLLLGNPLDQSRINLNLALTPSAQLDPALRDLLGLVAREVAGSFPLRISGTLARPQIN